MLPSMSDVSCDMKYSHGTFFIYSGDHLKNLKSFEDVFELLVANNASEAVPEINKLLQLNVLLTGSAENIFRPVDHKISETSNLLLTSCDFRDAMSEADEDRLGKLSSAWADSESFRDTNVNPFDLYGLLHFLKALCIKARDESKELYFLLSDDSDLSP
jgi:hypothetical protein